MKSVLFFPHWVFYFSSPWCLICSTELPQILDIFGFLEAASINWRCIKMPHIQIQMLLVGCTFSCTPLFLYSRLAYAINFFSALEYELGRTLQKMELRPWSRVIPWGGGDTCALPSPFGMFYECSWNVPHILFCSKGHGRKEWSKGTEGHITILRATLSVVSWKEVGSRGKMQGTPNLFAALPQLTLEAKC